VEARGRFLFAAGYCSPPSRVGQGVETAELEGVTPRFANQTGKHGAIVS
jgi:hypothetical protein